MRALWSLPKAAPALLRHIAAYAELIGLDIARAQREVTRSLVAALIGAVCGLLALFFGCIALIAFYWDTPYRVPVILAIAGAFVLVAVVMFLYRAGLTRSEFLGDVRRQWEEDRVLLERIVSPGEEQRP